MAYQSMPDSVFQYFLLNRHYSIEPRVALRWQVATETCCKFWLRETFAGRRCGRLSYEIQLAPDRSVQPNKALDFSRAHHFVLGNDFLLLHDLRFNVEGYYQYLYDIPVMPGTYYSMLNSNGVIITIPL